MDVLIHLFVGLHIIGTGAGGEGHRSGGGEQGSTVGSSGAGD
ncbi:hypothetical protein [Streptomyces fungicidicus]